MKVKTKSLPKTRKECFRVGYESGAIDLSRLLDEHPEEWNGPCMCALCMSYADLV
jgi:hypothetical protein